MTDTPQTLPGCMILRGKLSPNHRALPTVAEFVRALAARVPQPYSMLRATTEGVERLARFLDALGRASQPGAPSTRTGKFNFEQEVRICVHPGSTVMDADSPRFGDDMAVVLLAEVVFHNEALSRGVWDRQARNGPHILSVVTRVQPETPDAEEDRGG